jgi:3-hydroxyisobutyrate dehydrogenase-like beta-hydroxyacid dehydrogenase
MADLANTTLLYLGEQNGKAQTLKLLNNLLSATGMAASCEAMILGVKAGLDPERMLEVINAGEASSSATRNKFPKSILPRRFDFGARMAITAKDISLTVGEAEDLGVPMWIGQAVRQIWKYAVSQGGAEKDGTSLITFLEPWAGVQVKAANVARSAAAEGSPQKIERPRFVIACESAVTDAVARQLAARGWDARGDNQGPRSCTIVAVTPGCTPAQFRAALPPASDGHCIVLNACLMRTDEAERIAQALAQEGHGYVDALLSGPARQVACGEATVLASGEAAFVDAAIPLLEALGKRVSRVGDMAGQAQLMHQITGSLAATLLAASCESFVTGAKAGLDPLTMTKILGIETGRNAASAHIIPEQVATRRFDHGKRIGESLRELSLLSEEASRRGVTTWILDRARLLYGLAAQMGSPEDDMTRLATYYERWAGTQVRTPLAPDAS